MTTIMNNKIIAVISAAILATISLTGCGSTPAPSAAPNPTASTQAKATPTQTPTNIVWDDTTVFGRLISLDDETLVAIVGDEERTYKVTDQVKKSIEGLNIDINDTIAIKFEKADDDTLTALDVEKTFKTPEPEGVPEENPDFSAAPQ